jgi:caffeoyl-CoA O-methyltransferase
MRSFGIADPAAEGYAVEHTTAPLPELAALAAETEASLPLPQMLSGPVEGRLLELLVHAVRARLVLELGTYSGFSALSMAAGLADGGRIVTCEIDPATAEFARRHIEASPYAERIELRLGPALETIASLDGPFDLVFIDADKTGYRDYYEAVLPKLAGHGLIVVDNTLWSGRVTDLEGADESTRALAEFNDFVAGDPRVACVMLTVRDGITLIRRR